MTKRNSIEGRHTGRALLIAIGMVAALYVAGILMAWFATP